MQSIMRLSANSVFRVAGTSACRLTHLGTPLPRQTQQQQVQRQPRRCNSAMASAASGGTASALAARAAANASLKQRVRAGQPLFGLFINSASALVAEQLATLNFDYMLVRGRTTFAMSALLPCRRHARLRLMPVLPAAAMHAPLPLYRSTSSTPPRTMPC